MTAAVPDALAAAPADDDRSAGLDALRRAVTAFVSTVNPPAASSVADDTDLFAAGILDSLSTVKFVLFVERFLKTEIPAGEFALEKIASIASIYDHYLLPGRGSAAPSPDADPAGSASDAFVSSRSDRAGSWTAWSSEVRVPPFAAGLQFGVSVFEGMQALPGGDGAGFRIPFLAEHDARLRASARTLGLEAPEPGTFEVGLRRAVELCLKGRAEPLEGRRLYLRTVVFAGCEDIFPRSAHPFFCNIFARPVPRPSRPEPIHVMADRPYIRATVGSGLGAAKSAINYTQIVELERDGAQPADVQRLWLSPEPGHAVEELDTMGLGFVLADGTLALPPASRSKLASVTMKMLMRQMERQGARVGEYVAGLPELARHLDDRHVAGVFAASTGKGLGVVRSVTIGTRRFDLTPDPDHIAALWRGYTEMHASDDR